jgi:hypothetical protein
VIPQAAARAPEPVPPDALGRSFLGDHFLGRVDGALHIAAPEPRGRQAAEEFLLALVQPAGFVVPALAGERGPELLDRRLVPGMNAVGAAVQLDRLLRIAEFGARPGVPVEQLDIRKRREFDRPGERRVRSGHVVSLLVKEGAEVLPGVVPLPDLERAPVRRPRLVEPVCP